MKEAAVENPRPLRIPLTNEQQALASLERIEKLLGTLVEQGAKAANPPAAVSGARRK